KSVPAVAGAVAVTQSGWFRWAVAAAVILAVGGTGITGALYSQNCDRVERSASHLSDLQQEMRRLNERFRTRVDHNERELAEIEQEIQNLTHDNELQQTSVWQEVANKHFQMVITGPQVPEPGAPNNYKVETRSLDKQQPAPAQVNVRVLDEKQKVLFHQE